MKTITQRCGTVKRSLVGPHWGGGPRRGTVQQSLVRPRWRGGPRRGTVKRSLVGPNWGGGPRRGTVQRSSSVFWRGGARPKKAAQTLDVEKKSRKLSGCSLGLCSVVIAPKPEGEHKPKLCCSLSRWLDAKVHGKVKDPTEPEPEQQSKPMPKTKPRQPKKTSKANVFMQKPCASRRRH